MLPAAAAMSLPLGSFDIMSVVGVVGLVEALSKGEFNKLSGTPEGHEVDFKSAPYLLDQPKHRWELAKDVAAFANSGGGCIVIGCQTEKHVNEVVEAVSSVSEVPRSLVDVARYQSVISSWVYPSPQGVTYTWYPPVGDKGLLLIRVPAAPESDRPLVVRRFLEEAGKEYSTSVGVPRRNGDRVEWDPPERLHSLLVSARLMQSFMVTAARDRESSVTKQEADRRAADLRNAAGLDDKACVLLQLRAPQGTDFQPHLIGQQDSIAKDSQNWEGLRPRGFRLHGSAEPQVTPDGIIIDSTRWYARVSNDGWFEFAGGADYDQLGWGMDRFQRTPGRVRLNPLAVVEVIHDCYRFAQHVLAPRAAPGAWKGWIRAYQFEGTSVEVRVNDWGNADAGRHDVWERDVALSGDAERDAFEALWRLFLVFGISKDEVPYTSGDRVDTAAIQRA